MASTLYENVEDWHSGDESKILLSSDKTGALSSKEDGEDHDDGFEDICPKQQLTEITEKEPHVENEHTKENGHDFNGVNGNGVHEELEEDEGNDNDEGEEGCVDSVDEVAEDQHKEEESDGSFAETNAEDTTPAVPFYGRTLVAPEYMNFKPPEETSRTDERSTTEGDASRIAAMEEFDVQVDENHEEDHTAEETFAQTVEKEVLEEDDIISSDEESDDNGNYDVKDESAEDNCQVKEEEEEQVEEDEEEEEELEEKVEKEEEEEEERVEQCTEEKEEEKDPEDGSKFTPVEEEGSPQLAQGEEDEAQSENDEPEIEDNSIKEEDEEEEEDDAEEVRSVEVEPAALETEDESCLQLGNTDDEDSDHGEEIDNEDKESASKSSLENSADSMKVQAQSPTPDISNVSSAAQSFDDGEAVTTEDDDGNQVTQEESAREECSIETDEDEAQRNSLNGPIENHENHQSKHGEGHETVDAETFQDDDSEEDRDGGDETASAVYEGDQEVDGDLDVDIRCEGEVEETDTSREVPCKDDYPVHFSFQGQDNESDLTGRVKELGKMFEGGGPIFPSAGRNSNETVDGSPVSVRRYKAIFEQDRWSAERAREPGRREELANPPRGIVKNLRGLFENPQGVESRKG